MHINIINYEMALGMDGILSKYAREMERALSDLGHEVSVTGNPVEADIHHHINYASYVPFGKDTTMITHITGDMGTEKDKVKKIKDSLKTSVGICFSQAMKDKLVKAGCPEEKLKVVLPARDDLEVRPRIIACVYNIYPDGRKCEKSFIDLVKTLDKSKFVFNIMGKGWEPVLEKCKGLQVSYIPEFRADLYQDILNTADYLLYTGQEDALAQSIIDAKYCLLKVIAPPQDDLEVIEYTNQKELNSIFADMIYSPVKDWNWESYAKSHLKIWKKL